MVCTDYEAYLAGLIAGGLAGFDRTMKLQPVVDVEGVVTGETIVTFQGRVLRVVVTEVTP